MSGAERGRPRDFQAARWNEPLIFELGSPGERGILVPEVDPGIARATGRLDELVPAALARRSPPALPEVSEPRVLRHYIRLSQETIGADSGISMGLGTCTMKYNPKVHEALVRSHKLLELHPYQDESTVQGILEIMHKTQALLARVSGMDRFSFQPSSGSQAIYANASIVRAYHRATHPDQRRDQVITTIFSHPANAGAPSTAGFKVLTLMPDEKGMPDIEALKALLGPRTAALFITNPEDTGIFNPRIREFVDLVHEAGGLCVYDQANANGLLGIARAGDAGFDLMHFNLHKTFGSPHGSMGPGCGALGATKDLARFLPVPTVEFDEGRYRLDYDRPQSIGKVRKFYGVAPVVLRAYAYIMSMGEAGLRQAAELSVLNNNYLVKKLRGIDGLSLPFGGDGLGMLEQTRCSWERLERETGVGSSDISRRSLDYGMQEYFESHHPWIVPEPFTPEPCETYSKADIDEYAKVLETIAREAREDPELVKSAPHRSSISRIEDESRLEDMEAFAVTWRAFRRKGRPAPKTTAELPEETRRVVCDCGTEPPFRNAYWDHHEPGIYVDVLDGRPLFSSEAKFDSGSGWPSFWRPIDESALSLHEDGSFGMRRVEVKSAASRAHLGHLFNDGPEPTGLRYCINSAALRFVPASRLRKEGYGELAGRFGL